MSNNISTNSSVIQTSYKDLLTLATAVKGDVPMDPTIKPMSKEGRNDQEWLEKTIRNISLESNPIKKLAIIIEKFRTVEPVAELESDDLENLQSVLENNLLDLICDMDLAYDFCKMGGLEMLDKFLVDSVDKRIAGSFLRILSEVAANNTKAQELLIKRDYLNYCLNGIILSNVSELFVKQCLGAVSAMVKAYIPGLIKFTRLNGLDKLKRCFDISIDSENKVLVHRCGIVVSNIAGSIPERIVKEMKVLDLLEYVKETLEKNGKKYEETLEYINS